MTTSIDIRTLVAAACSLLFFAATLALFLRATWTDRFRRAANLFAGSLAAFVLSATGVFISQDAPMIVSALLIISGAHVGILLAYLSIHESITPARQAGLILVAAAVICLAQTGLAALFQSAKLLIVTTSVVNTVTGFVTARSLWRLATRTTRQHRLLASAPFLVIGCAYAMRLPLLGLADPTQWFVLASTVIAFVLTASALFMGFALIIIRESALRDDLRRAQAETEEMLQQRTRLFTQMNHELRTPLNGIVGLTRILSGHVTDEKGKRTLRDLQFSAALLKTVVDDVLDFAKLDRGALELESIPFDLAELLEEVVAQYRGLAADKGVTVRFDLTPATPAWRKGDPMRLRQLLHNVIGNAVKFTPQGTVGITVDLQDADHIRIRVTDTGIGMSPDQLAHLFEPFRQASASTTRQFGGTGLGMSIVQMLVDAMSGRIRAESALGIGTQIDVTLPMPAATPPKAQPSDAPAKAHPAPASNGLRVLSADDDEINGLVMEAFLVELGLAPVMAQSGRHAIDLATSERFDVYLIDINMPDMDGIETLAELRRIDAARGGPLPLAVAVTANVMADDIRNYLRSGFDLHLPKPVVLEDLSALLDRPSRAVPLAGNEEAHPVARRAIG